MARIGNRILVALTGLAAAQTGMVATAQGGQAPPPPSQPSMPPPETELFVIFFEWDETGIGPNLARVLNNAVDAYHAVGRSRVILHGHADRSGPERYNVALSRRRAENVRSYLIERGLPEEAISLQAHGESRPLVRSDDGVRELMNRRVEIILGFSSLR